MSSSQRRRNRMRWWFEQMRVAVEQGHSPEPCGDRFSAATSGSDRGEVAPSNSTKSPEKREYECIDKIESVQNN
jgi:hypothetical protein